MSVVVYLDQTVRLDYRGVYICMQGLEVVFRVGFAILQLTCQELLSRDMEGMLNVSHCRRVHTEFFIFGIYTSLLFNEGLIYVIKSLIYQFFIYLQSVMFFTMLTQVATLLHCHTINLVYTCTGMLVYQIL